MHSRKSGRSGSSAPTTDLCSILPILACSFPAIVAPLLYLAFPPAPGLEGIMEPRLENRLFWPLMAAVSVTLAVRNQSRLSKLSLPPNIICLIAYAAFAGASIVWSFKPDLSLTRFIQEVMVLTSIVLPAMLADRRADIMRGLFLCFACDAVVNLLFVMGGRQDFANYGAQGMVMIGYPGYFAGKNLLGEFSVVTFLLALHEMFHRGFRRVLGLVIAAIAILLLVFANSKTALGLVFLAPLLAGLTLWIVRITRISPAILLLSIPVLYILLSSVSNFNVNRLSFILYGDSTLTGRTIIWDFADYEISRRPLFGWGYQSFWLSGPDSPSIVDAPGWVKLMPNSHNGYMDTKIELGYIGLALLVSFLLANLHGIGRIASRAPAQAWLLLSIALFIIVYNFLESLWMRGFDLLWVVFVIVAADIARHWQPLTKPAHESMAPGPGGEEPPATDSDLNQPRQKRFLKARLPRRIPRKSPSPYHGAFH